MQAALTHALPAHCVSYKRNVWQITIPRSHCVREVPEQLINRNLRIWTPNFEWGLYVGVACSWNFTVHRIWKFSGASWKCCMHEVDLELCVCVCVIRSF